MQRGKFDKAFIKDYYKIMTQRVAEKLNQEISNLKKEMNTLRSFIIGNLARDQEGEYKPEFVKRVLHLSKEKADSTFKGSKDFLAKI